MFQRMEKVSALTIPIPDLNAAGETIVQGTCVESGAY
jgi:hypothetical protein